MVDRITAARGHTLAELMVMLGITAILAAAAVPLFQRLLLDSRMNAAVTTAMHAANLARQFSATRGETIHLCGSAGRPVCSGREEWSGSMLLANDHDEFRQLLEIAGGDGAPGIHSNRASVSFEAGTGFATPATITICDRRGPRGARAVIISRSGRPRASSRDASDRPLKC
jgi:type IV fimbrial biogenesis protein FimT